METTIREFTQTPPYESYRYEPIMKTISKQLDIKLGRFTLEELGSVLRKIENRKAAGLDEISPKVKKTREFDDRLL